MKKDIEIPLAKNIQIVAIKEWDKDFLTQNWNVYLLNLRNDIIETVLVMSRDASEDRKTSTLRHGLGTMQSNTSAKVELITDEVLAFTNEYLVTFFAENKLFERRFVFEANTIKEENTTEIPLMEGNGVLATY